MDLGLIVMPNHPPERGVYEGAQWDLQVLQWADQLGYKEAWFGEHFTIKWEPHCAPDILIAQALMVTERIKLCAGAHLLPYHHPVELAHRVALLDQLARGRYMFGIGTGGFRTDADLFGIDQRYSAAMTMEALEIIEGLWAADDSGFTYDSKYWGRLDFRNEDPERTGLFIKPFQQPGPPIGMAGLSPRSSTLKLAGKRGFYPLSLNLSHHYLASHWEAYEEGAVEAGLVADRRNWRVSRDIFVADTDEEAMRLCVDGMMGRTYREFFIPFFKAGGLDRYMVPDGQELTVEWLAKNAWLVGSPESVAERLQEQYNAAGGWGVTNLQTWDYSDNPEAWRNCLELLATEVVPRLELRDITPAGAAA
ncbi:LLM class flavin-dependent oxidoreductase [Conexibacter sp. CPCC 206217]|uniref:LLM class flavin-dependent oxidoreductase n=1 Tax=Conexibacter sp. CPCC 206217 TaxID=3064574 RepID=UPI002725FBCC|nr:LLM class flavin-dependent oxidoreductase [Conexibacter sp. CPCC 206217]MDO8208934.1 LLM class flavin-dependent oxidoreductase [Conexibacter sp. CPCC 206217]